MAQYEFDDKAPSLGEGAWIAPSADVIGEVILGAGASVWFGATVRADNTPIHIGERSNVQENAVLHSDPGSPLKIGSDVTVGHNAILHGCTIGDRTLVGMGATVMNDARIGSECIVAAGALITEGKSFPDRSLIVGAPAKAIRTLGDDSVGMLKLSAASYVQKAGQFSSGLKKIAD
ncbi:gamma carbonic anhydrase family protein [Pacificimonas flava]|uniref:Carbonic anhydrase, family 3 n=1 Tax=Pacificimonas flava TaxID=1234595 RepID=M2U814_9SPHN|nr:gamma carbonic anhydrase family protein [Pacificimonas flava]EMD84127.1 carbonic anhydrase, family 3 [Pacificimonas flava]MBB5279996.1 carbonic anhydrase/acetyltransferase-like protein (isoleucine patch superfamily) [Pacificimonas flava]